MKIVIIGSGTVGAGICQQLAAENHDITVVDVRSDAVIELSNTYDVIGVVGNGAEVSVLRRAGVDKADLVIAVTPHDEVNIIICGTAKKLGARHTVARVVKAEYAETLLLLKNDLNLAMTVNPELSAAKSIYRMLCYPSAAKVETFYRGRVELVEFVLTSDSPFCNKSLIELRASLKLKFLVCGVLRDGKMYIPGGDFVLQVGDIVGVTASNEELKNLFKAAGTFKQPIRHLITVGGGRITYYLQGLMQKSRIQSTVIEKNKALCYELTEKYDCTVVCDDGTKQEVLLEEGIETADAFLALTEVDEKNAVLSMYARGQGVPKVITLINELSYVDFYKEMDLESTITPKSITSTEILLYLRALSDDADSEIESLHRVMGGNAEALEFIIKQVIDDLTGIPLKSLRLISGVLIACLIRNGKLIIPSGDDVIMKGDTVIVFTSSDNQLTNVKDILK